MITLLSYNKTNKASMLEWHLASGTSMKLTSKNASKSKAHLKDLSMAGKTAQPKCYTCM